MVCVWGGGGGRACVRACVRVWWVGVCVCVWERGACVSRDQLHSTSVCYSTLPQPLVQCTVTVCSVWNASHVMHNEEVIDQTDSYGSHSLLLRQH